MQCISTAVVKISVESVVESLVSRYENHFDSGRQLNEDRALDEMEISENGPELVKADVVLTAAMNKQRSPPRILLGISATRLRMSEVMQGRVRL